MELRRVITGTTAAGKSVIAESAAAPVTAVAAQPDVTYYRIWGTEDGASVPNTAVEPMPYWPGTAGTRCVVVRWAPQSGTPEAASVSEDDELEVERVLPGLVSAFEPDHPAFHTTRSIDYGICLQGELYLIVDDEEELQIRPGTCVVQRGTRHAWENRTDQDALMLFVLVGADDPTKL